MGLRSPLKRHSNRGFFIAVAGLLSRKRISRSECTQVNPTTERLGDVHDDDDDHDDNQDDDHIIESYYF